MTTQDKINKELENFLQTALIWCNTCQINHPIVNHFSTIEIVTALTKIIEEER